MARSAIRSAFGTQPPGAAKKMAGRTSHARSAAGAHGASDFKARIRMYRQGLGDCFLVSLPRGEYGLFHILIDCGVILGTEDATEAIQKTVGDIKATTGGRIDLVIPTHEHWDHVSGFLQAENLFREIDIGQTWMGWTEDPHDEQAKRLTERRHAMIDALRLAAARLRVSDAANAFEAETNERRASEIDGLLDFFGASGRYTTKAALEAARALSPNVRYCSPEDAPVRPDGVNALIYVLGPPREEDLLKRHRPSARHPETYELASLDFFLDDVGEGLRESDPDSPFAEPYRIPAGVARQIRFFRNRYYRSGGGEFLTSQDWRRIDSAWLHMAPDYALKLDSATNNTSLVLAIEFDDGDVLLFPADAQVGSWLSWQTLSWKADGRKVTGPDLLKRTVFYKVGHHGSHNATLRELGLEQMRALRYAMIPVDEAAAKKKNWNNMPLPGLLDELTQRAELGMFRIDEDMADDPASGISSNELFHELKL